MNSLQKLFDFLNRLDDTALSYTLQHEREDTIMVLVSIPSERWEVEFFADGSVDVEVFYSNSEEDGIEDEEALERLFEDYSDEEFEEDQSEESGSENNES